MHHSYPISSLLIGTIEEIDAHKIKQPDFLFHGGERHENEQLIESIRKNGLLQPIIVRIKEDFFEIVVGCRRYNACRALGIRKIVCQIVELDDKSAFEVSLTENLQRRSLDPVEEAKAFKAYVEDFGWGGLTELATRISKSTSYVCKRLALLELPAGLLQRIRESDIKLSTAEELIPLKDSNKISQVSDIIIRNHCSSRQARRLVKISQDGQADIYADEDLEPLYNSDKIADIEFKSQRSFDKSITALKIAKNKIVNIIESVEDNWIVYEILMQHKNMLSSQIDILIREKRKLG